MTALATLPQQHCKHNSVVEAAYIQQVNILPNHNAIQLSTCKRDTPRFSSTS